MKTLRYLWRGNSAFYKNWWQYAILVVVVQAVIKHLFIPLYTLALEVILAVFRINYISYNNLGVLLKYGGLPLILIVILAILMLLTAYLQFAFMLTSIYRISSGKGLELLAAGRAAWNSLRSSSLPGIFLFLLYVALVLPTSSSFFTSSLLKKIVIPDFILEFLSQNIYYAIAIFVGFLVLTYFSIRLVRVLPLMLDNDYGFKEALHTSWDETKGHFIRYVIRVGIIAALTVISITLAKLAGVALQEMFDVHWKHLAFASGIFLTFSVEIIEVLLKIFETILLAFIIIFPNAIPLKKSPTIWATFRRQKRAKVVFGTSITIFAAVLVLFNISYLVGSFGSAKTMLTISHRGVDAGNGVQNTLPALERTAKVKPDYVEMDLHETKDHQFVVMHDENLKALTGVDRIPHDMTLAEITKLTAHENGQEARVVSFDDYLATAERLNQKLLVEIKTTKYDSPQLMDNFKKKYGKRLVQNHDMIHSLDYRVISKSEELMPKIPASFILPYTLILPNTNANLYTLEETTLNQKIVDEAHNHNQRVLAWTINEESDMQQMVFLNTDGIITDNLTTLKEVLKDQNDNPSYAKRMSQLLDVNWQSAF